MLQCGIANLDAAQWFRHERKADRSGPLAQDLEPDWPDHCPKLALRRLSATDGGALPELAEISRRHGIEILRKVCLIGEPAAALVLRRPFSGADAVNSGSAR
jgi:hypothetical protein